MPESLRIEKLAMLLSMSDEEEEAFLKKHAVTLGYNAAVTIIAGPASKISMSYAKSIMNAAIAGGVIQNRPGQVHAVLHASLEAFQAIIPRTFANNIKTKVAIVSNGKWVVVTAYGDSAFSTITNHVRCGMGFMHM